MGTSAIVQGIDIIINDAIAPSIAQKLNGIAQGSNIASAQVDKLQSSINQINASNIVKMSTAASGSSGTIKTLSGNLDKLESSSTKAATAMNNLTTSFQSNESAAAYLTNQIQALQMAYAGTNAQASQFNQIQVQQRAATSGSAGGALQMRSALQLAEGSTMGATRAAASFLSGLSFLTPVMEAAFPIIGALALLDILVQMIGKVIALTNDWGQLRSIQDASFKAADTGLAEQIRMQQELRTLRRDEIVDQAKLQGSHAGENQRGRAAGYSFDVAQDKAALQAAKDARDVLQSAYTQKYNSYDALTNPNAVDQAQKEKNQQDLATAATAVRLAEQKVAIDNLNESVAHNNDLFQEGKAAQAAYREAQNKIVEGWKEQEQIVAITHDNSKAAIADFWVSVVLHAQVGSKSYQDALKLMNRAQLEYENGVRKDTQATATAFEEYGRSLITEDNHVAAEKYKKDTEEQNKGAQLYIETQKRVLELNAQNTKSLSDLNTEFEVSTGKITSQTAQQREYAAALDDLNTKIMAVEQNTASVFKNPLYSENEQQAIIDRNNEQLRQLEIQKQAANLQNKIANPQSASDIFGGAVGQAFGQLPSTAKSLTNDFATLSNTVSNGVAKSFADAIVQGKDLKATFADLGRSIIGELLQDLIKLAMQALITKAIMAGISGFGGGGDSSIVGSIASGQAFSGGGPVKGYGGGGYIPQFAFGGGTSTSDSVLARLSAGEFVMNAQATKTNRTLLEAMNTGRSVGNMGATNVVIEDHTASAKIAVSTHTSGEIRLIAQDVVQRDSGDVIAGHIQNPNSNVSKSMNRFTQAGRKR